MGNGKPLSEKTKWVVAIVIQIVTIVTPVIVLLANMSSDINVLTNEVVNLKQELEETKADVDHNKTGLDKIHEIDKNVGRMEEKIDAVREDQREIKELLRDR